MKITPDMPREAGSTVDESGALLELADYEDADGTGVKVTESEGRVRVKVDSYDPFGRTIYLDRADALGLADRLREVAAELPDDAPEPPAAVVRNDTHGDLARAELDELRAGAHPCLRCGMLADVDPVLHEDRYGHRPKYRDESGRVFVWFAGRWAEKLDESAPGGAS